MEKEPPPTSGQEHLAIDAEALTKESLAELFYYEQQQYFIDSGGVGKVYELPGNFCIKVFEDRHNSPHRDLMDLGNPPEVEKRFQERMAVTSYEGKTRVPSVIVAIFSDLPGGHNAIIMERLWASNVQHILNGTVELPEKFNLDEFFADLEKFLNHMHTVDKIAHGDLYARNIMVDLDTGDPRVIDFGRAIDLTRKTEEEQQKAMDEDWERLDEVYEKLEALQNKKV